MYVTLIRSESGTPLMQDDLNVDLSSQAVFDSVDKTGKNCVPAGKSRVTPIHLRPDLLVPCADLVNSEWKRSQAARVHSLQKSCPDFPVCLLLLLQGPQEAERLLGHARLSRVVGHDHSLFVESVVVSKAERGKGYGRTLMEETELYARSRGFKRLCLTTHDKQRFYARLGYTLSTPVQSAGAMASFVPMETLLRFSGVPNGGVSVQKQRDAQVQKRTPPPAPPPPPISFIPPLPSEASPVVQSLTETPHRDAKGMSIFWMHKDL
ncbi:N-alpha-acetyltransferase 80 isoform X1 [Entelurus aequoreus]|uniref:N-alpha-acetyltransferase 80 isoform X1 n=2 Tax=Entelurus aequoreus TaxID=161455 RepID=UPI002B1E0108|nr:N-alpha-acetyltransferase 80 isoform X1 [Entelurus aequoreus]